MKGDHHPVEAGATANALRHVVSPCRPGRPHEHRAPRPARARRERSPRVPGEVPGRKVLTCARRPQGKIHRVDPDFGSTLTVSNRDFQSNCLLGQLENYGSTLWISGLRREPAWHACVAEGLRPDLPHGFAHRVGPRLFWAGCKTLKGQGFQSSCKANL